MQIFLSYKQSDLEKNILNNELNYIKNIIENTGNSIYIYYFEEQESNNSKTILDIIKKEIHKSDLVIGLVNYNKKSEGELLELGIAEALNKKILLLVKNEVKENYSLIYGLNCDILYYNDNSEIDILLTNYLKGK
ncbi:MAG: hypothetical protein PHS49_01950 [Candidatus Gracilibacteria bacterium]|nr:hypothetical protein [Candidatus Gracilibacteria bacterium]